MKRCSVCKEYKDNADFNKKSAAKDGLQPHCRGCSHKRFKAYYESNKNKHRQEVNARNKKVIRKNRAWLLEYFSTHPCVDCNNSDVRVLEFDHVCGEKTNGVATMLALGYSLASIKSEIDKCEVRCRNCHTIKTYERMGGTWHTLLDK